MKKILLIILCIASFGAKSQDLIRVINVVHHADGITDFMGEYRIPLPASLVGVVNATQIMEAYKGMYNIEKLDTISQVYYAVFLGAPMHLGFLRVVDNITTSDPCLPQDFYDMLQTQYNEFLVGLSQFQLQPSDEIIGKKYNGTSWNY